MKALLNVVETMFLENASLLLVKVILSVLLFDTLEYKFSHLRVWLMSILHGYWVTCCKKTYRGLGKKSDLSKK